MLGPAGCSAGSDAKSSSPGGHTHRYDLTADGCRVVVLFTKTYSRVLTPGLTAMDATVGDDVNARSRLGQAWRQLHRVLDDFLDAGLAAVETSPQV